MTFHPRRWLCASLGVLIAAGCTSIPEKIDEGVPMKVAAQPPAAPAPVDPAPPQPTVLVTGVQAADGAPPLVSPWEELRQRLK